jgi:hypothetical protein
MNLYTPHGLNKEVERKILVKMACFSHPSWILAKHISLALREISTISGIMAFL